jgi:hypothetical protein
MAGGTLVNFAAAALNWPELGLDRYRRLHAVCHI